MNRYGSLGEDRIGVWSEEKLDILEKYLVAYSTIMNKQKEKWLKSYHYIDAFAGSVGPVSKDEERYIEGSPLRALKIKPSFDGYWFIDINPKRIARLKELQDNYADHKINIRQDDCNYCLCNEIVTIITKSSKQRAIVFLDPYGLQVNWKTVIALAEAETFDIFINFSLMGITRLLKRDEMPLASIKEKISQVMGSAAWIDQIYHSPSSVQLSLFEEPQPSQVRETLQAELIADLYAEQLKQLFKYISQPVIMKNSTNSPLYALFLASHNETGVKIMNDIFNRYEKLKKKER